MQNHTTMPTYACLLICLVAAFFSCDDQSKEFAPPTTKNSISNSARNIRGISLPQGFSYLGTNDTSFASWLLDLKLKENNTVFLYNGRLKGDQSVQFGVLDIPIGKRDVIQCADAAIKLRADFLFAQKRYEEIKFAATSGDEISFDRWIHGIRWKEKAGRLVPFTIIKDISNMRKEYDSFMELVFAYCGTYSLSKQLKPVDTIDSIKAGDVFVQGGFPGHAVTVMAVAKNNKGEKIFLLSQGYMPAQDIHILKNYSDAKLSPWYSVKETYPLYTPEWKFGKGSLKRW